MVSYDYNDVGEARYVGPHMLLDSAIFSLILIIMLCKVAITGDTAYILQIILMHGSASYAVEYGYDGVDLL
jgi:hypothetical protein